jgi:hypothetical protein
MQQTMKTGKLEAEYWGDPSGNIRRMSGEQEIIATITGECTEEEFRALCSIGARSDLRRGPGCDADF